MTDKEDIKEEKKLCYNGWFYAGQRIDLLIISISGAGIYIILETLKYSLEHQLCNNAILKVSGILFTLAIIINIISQLTAMSANSHGMLHCEERIKADEILTEKQIIAIAMHDCRANTYSEVTHWLNVTSMLLMFVGLSTLIIFFLITF